jgi:hypothetical protein
MNVTAMLGPVMGGALLAASGPRARPAAGGAGVLGAYAVLLLLYLVQLANYGALRLAPRPPTVVETSLWQHLVAGLRYSRTEAGLS